CPVVSHDIFAQAAQSQGPIQFKWSSECRNNSIKPWSEPHARSLFVPREDSGSTATLYPEPLRGAGCAVLAAFPNPSTVDDCKTRTGKSAWATRCFAATSIPRRRQLLRRRFLGVQRLQWRNLQSLFHQRANPASRRIRGGERGDARNIVANRRAPDGFLIVKRFAAERRIYDHVNFTSLYQVHNIWPPFIHLIHGLRRDTCRFERS